MPNDYPPYSTTRHSARQKRRSGERQRDSRVRHQPFAGEHEEREKETSWKAIRGHLVAMSGEFIGTTMFLWFAFAGTQVASMSNTGPAGTSNPAELLFISLSFGSSLAVVVWAFYRISGGLFNPAVTLGLCITSNLPWIRGLLLFPAQLLGGITAAALVSCMLPGPLAVVVTLNTAVGTTVVQGVFIEAFLTALLVFAILMLAAEKHEATFIAPIGIGLALFVAELAGVYFTGGALNPTRAFGPSVVTHFFPHYHWLYWIGPLIGSLMAGAYYRFVKYLNYEEANPGQDAKRG